MSSLRQKFQSLLIVLIVTPLAFYVLYAAGLFFGQRAIIFPAGIREVAMPVDKVFYGHPTTTIEGCPVALVLPEGKTAADCPIFIVAHGNAELISDYLDLANQFARRGCGLLLVEFPGYGGAPGKPGRDTLGVVFDKAYDWLVSDQQGADLKRVYGLGRSIGTGVVCDLSRSRDLAGLVLLSPFADLRDLARRRLLPGFLLRHPFNNEAAVADFDRPVLVFHGLHDRIIPVEDGRRVAKASAKAELVLLEYGHNDIPFDDTLTDRIVAFVRK